jgi:membrane-bound metal-dependent hydrolase YbcI (DUF457 family)
MCWGYITGKLSSSSLHVNVNPFLLLFLAALPDVDLVLGIFGIQHRTWTHSVLLWSVVFAPFFIKYKKTAIPYFVAVISHILLGDAIVGRNNPIWPIGNFNFSLGYGLLSIQNIIAEAAGLVIFLVWAIKSKDARKSFFGKSRRNLWSILPIVFLTGFILFTYSFNVTSDAFEEYGILKPSRLIDNTPSITGHQLFPIEMAMHLILLSFLSVSLIQGFRKQTKETTLKS